MGHLHPWWASCFSVSQYLSIAFSQSPCLFLFVFAVSITAPFTQAYANSLCQSSLPYLCLICSFTFTSVPSTHSFPAIRLLQCVFSLLLHSSIFLFFFIPCSFFLLHLLSCDQKPILPALFESVIRDH